MREFLEGVKAGLASRKFWRVAAVWLVCLLYVLFQGGKTSFMLLMMVSVLAAYWAIGGLGGVKRIRGTRNLSLEERGGVLQAGQQVLVRLRLQLPAFMPLPYLVIRETLKRHNGDTWAFEDSVVPYFRGRAELVYKTPPLERGKYVFAGTTCSAEDIFGLIEHTGTVQSGGEFRILPRTVFIPHWGCTAAIRVWPGRRRPSLFRGGKRRRLTGFATTSTATGSPGFIGTRRPKPVRGSPRSSSMSRCRRRFCCSTPIRPAMRAQPSLSWPCRRPPLCWSMELGRGSAWAWARWAKRFASLRPPKLLWNASR